MGEIVVEGGGILFGGEVAAFLSPLGDGVGDAADEGADTALALGGPGLAMEVLRGDDVGRGHGPVDGDLDILLLEDDFAAHVIDGGGAALPLDFVIGRDAGAGELAREAEAGGGSGFGRGGGGCGDGIRLWGCLRGLGHLGAPPESSNGMFRRPLPVRPRLHGGAWAGRGASGGGCEFLVRFLVRNGPAWRAACHGPVSCRRWQSTAAYRFKSSENHNI